MSTLSDTASSSPSTGAAGDDQTVVRVADTGYGIAPEEQERILECFYRVKDAATRHIVGSGLGLCIAKRVVDDLGGKSGLDSAPGQGSTFTVRLPGA